MIRVKDISDDFYVNVNLNTETELAATRETTLHYFEQLQKRYSSMRNFYSRERGEYVLEENKEQGHYRWSSVDARRVCSGYVNPSNYDDAIEQHQYVLEQLPYSLSLSPLDCESLNFMYGFDYTYRGNHNELIVDALGLNSSFEGLNKYPGSKLIGYEPSIQFSLDEECRTHCRITIESRSSTFAIRSGEFPEEQLSVYMTIRRYGSLDPDQTFVQAIKPLQEHAEQIFENYLLGNILEPLQQRIAIQ